MNTLFKANELECESLSIPGISSTTSGFPKHLTAKLFFKAIKKLVQAAKQ